MRGQLAHGQHELLRRRQAGLAIEPDQEAVDEVVRPAGGPCEYGGRSGPDALVAFYVVGEERMRRVDRPIPGRSPAGLPSGFRACGAAAFSGPRPSSASVVPATVLTRPPSVCRHHHQRSQIRRFRLLADRTSPRPHPSVRENGGAARTPAHQSGQTPDSAGRWTGPVAERDSRTGQ
ncbi:hypothetical protein [Streptomyces sp. NPDC045714]|uniref:hypothetical protein n=1 Tax=Streptomyces sp. NPDC045714 TaxID=3154913 RepID=UPI0033E809B0